MNTLTKLFLAALLCFFLSNVSAQESYFIVSKDTLIADEMNEFLINVGYYSSADQLLFYITPTEYIDRNLCSDCNEDTINITTIVPYNDTIVSVSVLVPYGTYPERYKMEYYDSGIPQNGFLTDWLFIVSRPYLTEQPEDHTVCLGTDIIVDLKLYAPNENLYQWYLNDILLEGFNTKSMNLLDIGNDKLGEYVCIISNETGADTVEFSVSTYQYPEDIGTPEGLLSKCMGSDISVYLLPEENLIKNYNWVLLPDTAATLTMDGNSVSVQWNENFVGEAQLFAEISLEHCQGNNSDTAVIKVSGPEISPEICIVGMDEDEEKYRIVWNEINDESIVQYNIYRESNIAGEYLGLGVVPVGEFSVFLDESSSPSIISHSYAISYTDTCGNESELSLIHSTIHLSSNVGTSGENNLIWTPYIGFPFLSYDIYRGSNPEEMTLLQQVNSNVTSFTDFDAPSGNVYYQIVVSRDGQCNPSKKSTEYSLSKSNITDFISDIEDLSFFDHASIYPNPVQTILNIHLNIDFYGSCELLDITGRILSVQDIAGKEKLSFDVNNLESGYYILLFRNEEFLFTRKFVKQ